MPCLEWIRDPISRCHEVGTSAASHERPALVASRAMRRSRRLALALSVATLCAPALAAAQATTPAAPATTVKSPFTADRLSSKPSGLTPDAVATPVRYPEQSIVLTWGDVPGAVGYSVEISDTPGFGGVVWSGTTTQPVAVPEVVLPDGAYWWRVRAADAAGVQGIWSDVARVAKTWPNQITGTRLSAVPGGPAVSHVALNPYLSWDPVPGAKTYDVEVSPGDQFNSVIFSGTDLAQPFATPAAAGALPDDTYQWRVRARDAKGNAGPWTVAPAFTKAWVRPAAVAPGDGASSQDVRLVWEPVDGAQRYEVQISDIEFNWTGQALKVSQSTAGTSFTPSLAEEKARDMLNGPLWWRVRPVIDGVYGSWSYARRLNWTAPSGAGATPTLTSTGDSDSGLSPHLTWTPVTGATIYRVDIAADPQFNNILESQVTTNTSWTSRAPLPDNQVGTGYHWRVVWGNGATAELPGWMVDEDDVPVATYRKQTRVTLGAPADGGLVSEPPLLSWGSVPGIARYDVEMSQDGTFGFAGTRRASLFGLGAVPGVMTNGESRLADGSWSWRVRAVDGGDKGQTWSRVGTFTLNSPRPAQKLPADGATVVFSPLVTWSPVPGACAYEVQVSRDPGFVSGGGEVETLDTAQTALVPPKGMITTPGVHYWRVRADYCSEVKGQWSPTRNFRSVFPPSFNLNTIPGRVGFRTQVVVSGQLKNNGSAVRKARLFLERRLYPSDRFRAAGIVRTNTQGRFRFALKMARSADYRLVWRASATNPEGSAAFGIDVQPRVTFRLASSRVQRKRGLLVKGSIYPKRPAVVQMRTSDGWKTLRKIKPTRQRFAVAVSTGRLDPGTQRLRLWVPRDKQRRFVNISSRQRGVLIYDRFVIR